MSRLELSAVYKALLVCILSVSLKEAEGVFLVVAAAATNTD